MASLAASASASRTSSTSLDTGNSPPLLDGVLRFTDQNGTSRTLTIQRITNDYLRDVTTLDTYTAALQKILHNMPVDNLNRIIDEDLYMDLDNYGVVRFYNNKSEYEAYIALGTTPTTSATATSHRPKKPKEIKDLTFRLTQISDDKEKGEARVLVSANNNAVKSAASQLTGPKAPSTSRKAAAIAEQHWFNKLATEPFKTLNDLHENLNPSTGTNPDRPWYQTAAFFSVDLLHYADVGAAWVNEHIKIIPALGHFGAILGLVVKVAFIGLAVIGALGGVICVAAPLAAWHWIVFGASKLSFTSKDKEEIEKLKKLLHDNGIVDPKDTAASTSTAPPASPSSSSSGSAAHPTVETPLTTPRTSTDSSAAAAAGSSTTGSSGVVA